VDPRAPRRRDAVETRERILRAAGEAFATRSGPPSLAQVAGRAGVSRATVYRHFADRRALGAAVIDQGLGALRGACDVPFRDLLHGVLATAARMGGLADLIEELPEPERRRAVRRLVDALTPAFRRAQAAGELRADADPSDLGTVLRAVRAAARGPEGEVAARRLLVLLLDGLFGPGLPAGK
jgi:AcrR family transcriptional regulator